MAGPTPLVGPAHDHLPQGWRSTAVAGLQHCHLVCNRMQPGTGQPDRAAGRGSRVGPGAEQPGHLLPPPARCPS